uniref:3-dehydroquinate synthase n=1 Tax=Gongylonema pulchrum TaxID=637853 RepID=A0A183DL75_9BILA
LSFENGVMTIKDLKEEDAADFYYRIGEYPHVLNILL